MASLIEFNKGYKYLLTCIDVVSKYAWVIPLKNKTGNVEAFKNILKSGRKPQFLQTDKGTELLNQNFQNLQKETKASVVERFNRTIKTKMWKYFTANNTCAYLETLPKFISAYNQSYHRSIKTTPASVTVHNDQEVWRTLYKDRGSGRIKFKFKVGDTVRISRDRFAKDTFQIGPWKLLKFDERRFLK